MSTLRVHCWRNEYLAPPGAAAQDLDRLVERLADAFAEGVDSLPGVEREEVILLRELRVACDLDLACAPGQVVQHWSRQLTGALAQSLEDGHALRFPSLAAYYARFITDLLHGRAWDSWMYRRFEGLRMLPAGAVVRTLLTEDALRGRATLAQVAPFAWPLLLNALPVREAARILWHWSGGDGGDGGNGGNGGNKRAGAARLAAWAAAAPELPGALAPPLAALALLGAWERGGEAGLPVGAACWIAALLALPGGTSAPQLRRIARRTDLDALRSAQPFCDDPDWLLLLATTPPAWRAAAAHTAATLRTGGEQQAEETPSPEQFAAPCAGLAWLLPALLQLLKGESGQSGASVESAAAALPAAPAGCDAFDLASLCLLGMAAGPGGERVWRDPFWRSFLRMPPAVSIAALDDWLAPHDPARFASAMAAALRAQALAPGVRLRGRPDALLFERGSGCPLGPAGRPGADEAPAGLHERLALARLARRDRAWLAASPLNAALPQPWRAAFTTLAIATLRRTANRIPGAARASIPYLFANVLGVGGEASHAHGNAAGQWSLTPARPPLHVLLALNGMARLRLDWPGARTLVLRSPD